ncbi:hypothetical protein K4F52_001918 [Lecanicillium sp. MT-2017a]|nr:hypothetical protein K4F52_001918 [Lecanicillium sp. MT-2017a]
MSSPFKYTNKLQGRRVLVVGGSSGVGFAVAEAAVEHGSIVTISSSNQTKLDKAVSLLKEHAKAVGASEENISSIVTDLATPEGIDDRILNMLKFATKGGKLDHIAFTAGDGISPAALKDTTPETIQAANMVRFVAPTIIAKYIPDYMTRSNKSSFTITGGTIAWRPIAGWSVVSGVGASVEGLARGLALDLKPVRVNNVVLGAILTQLFDAAVKTGGSVVLDKFAKDSVTGTIGKPDEVAEAYLYSMKASFTTGTQLIADGGRLVGQSEEVSEFN